MCRGRSKKHHKIVMWCLLFMYGWLMPAISTLQLWSCDHTIAPQVHFCATDPIHIERHDKINQPPLLKVPCFPTVLFQWWWPTESTRGMRQPMTSARTSTLLSPFPPPAEWLWPPMPPTSGRTCTVATQRKVPAEKSIATPVALTSDSASLLL